MVKQAGHTNVNPLYASIRNQFAVSFKFVSKENLYKTKGHQALSRVAPASLERPGPLYRSAAGRGINECLNGNLLQLELTDGTTMVGECGGT